MASDGCTDGFPDATKTPTFRVELQNWPGDPPAKAYVTWAKEVYVFYKNVVCKETHL